MKNLLVIVSIFFFAACGTKSNQPMDSMAGEIFTTAGVAIKGYDPVAFFKMKTAVKGSPEYVYTWKDVTWQFSSAENLEAFKANPDQYAPQYGGYCAYGTSAGHKAPTETDTWEVVDGKLYFNYNKKVKEQWLKDQQGLIKKADEQWPLIKNDQ